MARSAALIYGGATLLNLGEQFLPRGPELSALPGLASLIVTVLLVVVGERLPFGALYLLGPIGTALIGVAIATTAGYSDGAVIYMWPVIWAAYHSRWRGTAFIVAWTAVVHGVALSTLPSRMAPIDRWVDVVAAVAVVAVVVRVLSAERERLVARVSAEARSDALTGLANRRGFDERFAIEAARAERDGAWLAVVSFDLDHFKGVNDRHGHEAGDRVLAWFGALLAQEVRAGDLAARVGGEELSVVLPRADAAEGERFALRIVELFRADGAASGRRGFGVPAGLSLSVSAGVAAERAPHDGQVLLEAADRALYEAKLGGRDRVAVARDDGTTALAA